MWVDSNKEGSLYLHGYSQKCDHSCYWHDSVMAPRLLSILLSCFDWLKRAQQQPENKQTNKKRNLFSHFLLQKWKHPLLIFYDATGNSALIYEVDYKLTKK